MSNIWEKSIWILAENLNSGRDYHITIVKKRLITLTCQNKRNMTPILLLFAEIKSHAGSLYFHIGYGV